MEKLLRAELASGAPELQEKAQHAALACMGQRVRQAQEEGPGAQSSKGEPNRGLQ